MSISLEEMIESLVAMYHENPATTLSLIEAIVKKNEEKNFKPKSNMKTFCLKFIRKVVSTCSNGTLMEEKDAQLVEVMLHSF